MSRATSAIGRDVSITIFTASSLNSCVNFLRRSGILHPPFRAGLYWIRCPESPRHASIVGVVEEAGDAEAGGDVAVYSGDADRGDGGADLFRHLIGRVDGGLREQDEELLTA